MEKTTEGVNNEVLKYLKLDLKIKELERERNELKEILIPYMTNNKIEKFICEGYTLNLIEKFTRKLNSIKVFEKIGIENFLIVSKVTIAAAEKFLGKQDITLCEEEKKEGEEPERSLRVIKTN